MRINSSEEGATQKKATNGPLCDEEGHVHGFPNVASSGARERPVALLKLPHVATHDAPHLVLGRPNLGMVVMPRFPNQPAALEAAIIDGRPSCAKQNLPRALIMGSESNLPNILKDLSEQRSANQPRGTKGGTPPLGL